MQDSTCRWFIWQGLHDRYRLVDFKFLIELWLKKDKTVDTLNYLPRVVSTKKLTQID